MIEWINRVITLAAGRGYRVEWRRVESPYDPFAVVFDIYCPNGRWWGRGGAGSLMIAATTPEQYVASIMPCPNEAPAPGPIGTVGLMPVAGLQTNERRAGRFIPWRTAKTAYNAMEALF